MQKKAEKIGSNKSKSVNEVASLTPEVEKGIVARCLGNIGLCVRARKVVLGTELVCDALKSGVAKLVISVGDASQNTAKRLRDRCAYYGVRLVVLPCTGEELAAAVGRGGITAAVAITDASMVKMIEKAVHPLGI